MNVPLLDIPKMILEKYKGKLPDGKILPIISNQKLNAYLKEIADVCGVKKNLTFHLARHTFATTVYLCNGGTIEALSKILGHKHISTTQIYAEVTNKMVSSDFRSISGNLAAMQKKVLDKTQKKVKKQAVAMRETA